MRRYRIVDLVRACIPDDDGMEATERLLAPLITLTAADLAEGKLAGFEPYRFLYERLIGAEVRPWLVSAFCAAAVMPAIHPALRKQLLESIPLQAVTIPGCCVVPAWSRWKGSIADPMASSSPLVVLAASVLLVQPPALAADQQVKAEAVTIQTGIALDAPWKRQIYAFARQELLHPAWGWTHSERNYQLALQIAAKESLTIDTDILFAASFTHDIGAIGEFQKGGVDHAVRSVELAEPMLLDAGFPAEKLPAVREAILGHMHDKQPGSHSESIVLHDADALDFLGVVGVTRRLLVNGSAPDYVAGLARIREFADKLPARIITETAKIMAQRRAAEMRSFLDQLKAETADGRLP